MTTLKTIFITATLLCLAGAGWAQVGGDVDKNKQTRGGAKIEAQEVGKTINKLLANIESAKNDPISLNLAIRKLGGQLRDNRNTKIYISTMTTANVTEKLVKIYDEINDKDTNGANKLRIIEVIGSSDNSPLAREFFLRIMESGTEKQRGMALWSLSPKGVHGDEIYQKIKDMVKKGAIKEEDSLTPLQRADAEKALPEIRKFLATTNDVKQFVKAGLLLCGYHDPAQIDILLERQEDFEAKEPITHSNVFEDRDPAIAVGYDVLRKYIEVNEGQKIDKALRIFKKKGGGGDRELPLFEKKLTSSNLETRRIMVNFLQGQINGGNFSNEKVSVILNSTISKEKDEKIKTRLRGMLDGIVKKKQLR